MTIRETLFLIVGLQTLVILIVLLCYRSKKNHVNKYLGFFFMTICIEIFMLFVFKRTTNPAWHYLPVRFDFLTLTFLYFYTIETTGIKIGSKLKYYMPAIIEFIILLIAFIMVSKNSDYHNFLNAHNFDLYFRISSSIYMVVFSVLIIRITQQHRKLLPVYFSNTKFKSLRWLAIFCIGCIVLNIFRHLFYTFDIKAEFISIGYCSLSLFLLYYLTIASLIQININNVIPSQVNAEEEHKELENMIETIQQYLLDKKAYLDPDINLKSFSKNIGIPERDVSKAINRMDNKNFSNFINYYRVEEFKRLITSEEYKKYSISAIADEVGFSSRASFYKNFKEIEGVSPSVYIKS